MNQEVLVTVNVTMGIVLNADDILDNGMKNVVKDYLLDLGVLQVSHVVVAGTRCSYCLDVDYERCECHLENDDAQRDIDCDNAERLRSI